MPFIWSSDPNYPPVIPAPVIGPDEVSFDVHVVANTVNVHGLVVGSLSYNTANKGYDVIYELPSLNVRTLRAQTLNAVRATINTAFINTATINTATINTANISTATISNGILGVHPVQNLQIATKEYVDTLVANSVPLGGNLQLLIQAAGDLLVGVSDNTAARLPIGTTDGQVLMAGGSGNTGVFWRTIVEPGFVGTFRGLFVGTSTDALLKNTQVQIVSVDEIVMDDGKTISTGWNGLTASTTANGAPGFLDTGVVAANTWYEVWAIRNSSNGAQGLLLHQAFDRRKDVDAHIVGIVPGISRSVLFSAPGHAINVINISQSFIATKSGPFTAVEFAVARTGSPIGNCWITLEANNEVGNASGIPLATSRYMNVSRLAPANTSASRVRFIFDTAANVVSGNSYHCVYHIDHPPAGLGNENYTLLRGHANTAPGAYANGLSKNFSANTNSWEITNSGAPQNAPIGPGDLEMRTFVETNSSSLILPTGYNQKCLISYTCTDVFFRLKEYSQRQRRMVMSFRNSWRTPEFGASTDITHSHPQPVDLSFNVPPLPCIVQITLTGGFGGSVTAGIGHISCTDIGGSNPTTQASFFEAEGAAYANAFVAGVFTFSPILVEGQSMMGYLGSAANVYTTMVEF